MEWDLIKFLKRLDIALQKKGKRKKDLSAFILKKNHSLVSGWTTGHSLPSLEQIVKASEFLGVGPAWLAFGIGGEKGFGPEEERLLRLWDALNPGQRSCIRQVMRHFAGPIPGELSPDDPRVQRILEIAGQNIDALESGDGAEGAFAATAPDLDTNPRFPGARRKS